MDQELFKISKDDIINFIETKEKTLEDKIKGNYNINNDMVINKIEENQNMIESEPEYIK